MTQKCGSLSLENGALVVHLDDLLPVLPGLFLVDGSAELAVEHLHAVADAQHWQAQLEYVRIVGGRVGGVHRLGAAGDDDGLVATFLRIVNISKVNITIQTVQTIRYLNKMP